MSLPTLTGKALRMNRLSRDGRFLFVPMDHSVTVGPITGNDGFARLVRDVISGGADAIVVHKGRARMLDPLLMCDTALVVHLSASTSRAIDTNAKVLVGEVEEAVALGADAVSVHVNIGSHTEPAQLADLGAVAARCERWGLPLLAMVYPRGPHVRDPHDPELLAHVVNIAADLGADIVKTSAPAPLERMAEIAASAPIPVVLAGGEDSDASLADFARRAITAGASGLAVGRRIFHSSAPRRSVQELANIIHDPAAQTTTIQELAGAL